MTLFELQADTARLGFLPDIGDEAAFLACANRALLRVSGLRPLQKTASLLHLPDPNLLQEEAGVSLATEPLSYTAKGARAYGVHCVGEGMLRITAVSPEKPEEELLVELRELSGDQFYEGGIYLDATPIPTQMLVRLTLLPKDQLLIEHPALYAVELPPHKARVSVGADWIEYDLRKLCGDLLACEGVSAIGGRLYRCGTGKQGERVYLPDARVADAAALGITMPSAYTVRIPTKHVGLFSVTYRAAPTLLTGDGAQEVDLPTDLAVLLPLACAAELFYEEDPEKSAFYLKGLQAQAERASLYTPVQQIAIVDRTGW